MTADRVHPADNVKLPTGDSHHINASEPVPEADRLEQLTPIDPSADPAASSVLAPGERTWAGTQKPTGPAGPVDEGDWLEQQQAVPTTEGDDDYPSTLSEPQ